MKKNKLKQRYIDLLNEILAITNDCNNITDFQELEEVCEKHKFNHKFIYYGECDYYVYYITDKDDTWIMEIWAYREDYKTFKVTNISIN